MILSSDRTEENVVHWIYDRHAYRIEIWQARELEVPRGMLFEIVLSPGVVRLLSIRIRMRTMFFAVTSWKA